MKAASGAARPQPQARRLVVVGRVQGVGFRPFVYRLAHAHGINGWVRNDGGQVVIFAQASAAALEVFTAGLLEQAPPSSRPTLQQVEMMQPRTCAGFVIEISSGEPARQVHVPPDQFTCDDCLEEMWSAGDRRYRYPFINCTQCGPRYTLIRHLPYDRANTGMADFPLCPECRAEYENPLDRRFHAEPVACPRCGPKLTWCEEARQITGNEPALHACVSALREGAIVAVRGIGGYHLLCDAASDSAVERLRKRKQRPHKPLAVMVPPAGADGLAWVHHIARPNPGAAELLRHPQRPIVLLPKQHPQRLAAGIAPGLDDVGIMLPYSPLHHLLLADFGAPLVATSGNPGGEPVITDPAESERRLDSLVDGFLHHDRPIERPADDPVYRQHDSGRPRPLRLGRGNAPLELELHQPVPVPALALGSFLKNTVALAWDDRVVVSPHIGDLRSPASRRLRARAAEDLQALYQVRAEAIVHDAHPGFPIPAALRQANAVLGPVYHHHAHAAALAHGSTDPGPLLVFVWDGVGFGADGTLWGGEALVGRPGAWQRRASLRPFRLPGGDRAVAQPWRTALALCWQTGHVWAAKHGDDIALLRMAWERGLNCPTTSAAGRLFDAAAALTGLVTEASFDGHAPMWLEAAAADGDCASLPLERDEQGLWRSDWSPLLPLLTDARQSPAQRAGTFHASLAQAIVDQAVRIRTDCGVDRVGLSGGVFQNHRLLAQTRAGLAAHGFRLAPSGPLPLNDAGISFGQIVEFAARSAGR